MNNLSFKNANLKGANLGGADIRSLIKEASTMNKLQNAVVEQLGYDSLCEDALQTLSDVANHGAAGGYGGFTYYDDTVEFCDANKEDIDQIVMELARELGESVVGLVSGFTLVDQHVVESFLMGYKTEEDTTIKNHLAWFALEDTAYKLTER